MFSEPSGPVAGARDGPATKTNGLFHWMTNDSLILHKVAKAAGLVGHERREKVDTL